MCIFYLYRPVDVNQVCAAKTPPSPSYSIVYPPAAGIVQIEGFLPPFLSEGIHYKTLMYFSSPFLDLSHHNLGIKGLTLSQSWGCWGHYKFICPIDFGRYFRTIARRKTAMSTESTTIMRSPNDFNFGTLVNTVWLMMRIMVSQKSWQLSAFHSCHKNKPKNNGATSGTVTVNSHKFQEMYMFVNTYGHQLL